MSKTGLGSHGDPPEPTTELRGPRLPTPGQLLGPACPDGLMKILYPLSCLLSLVLADRPGQAVRHPKHSTWMLESVIARGEGINPADGLLGVIQKVQHCRGMVGLFQEALRAAIAQSSDAAEIARWSDYHRRSVEANIEDLLNATASSRDLSLDRLCVGRSIMEMNLDEPLHRNVLKALRKSLELQYRNENAGFCDGMYGFAPFAALYGMTYGDPRLNVDSALLQLDLLYKQSIEPSTGLIKHGYDASREAPWAHPITGASPIVWGRSLAWYLIGTVDTLEIIASKYEDNANAMRKDKTVQRILEIFQRLARATVETIEDSAGKTGRYAVWQVMDRPGEPGNFVEASASAMIAYVLAKGVRLGHLPGSGRSPTLEAVGKHRASSYLRVQGPMPGFRDPVRSQDVLAVARALYQDVVEQFVVRRQEDDTLDFLGTSIIASLHEEKPYYEVRFVPFSRSYVFWLMTISAVLYSPSSHNEQLDWDQCVCPSLPRDGASGHLRGVDNSVY
ncbi:putative glycosyl hydrolase family 88 [Aspergillus novofumigatus IBT 16806]|uniref:Family 88 putative glycosyl hydrolase n=1 Tax=Aspergillus novofumigatus (strain IBT 16806) TaxID=1392255 RepID=A0A2I1BWZ8_ASPN1|nr:family 88 putative glycosyl hydrolase [Aspergillus novofumigatus IBT 16806]PKX89903.1 family 88 putative glycosyl hydrolase [Aspergillus novofumigatus IBT 16806]